MLDSLLINAVIMKKVNLLIAMLLCLCINGTYAQISKTVHVETAGQLSSLLTDEEKATITNLTVTGNINKTDMYTMYLMDLLEVIDMGDTYLTGTIDLLPFALMLTLKSVILSSSTTSYDPMSFESCIYLTSISIPSSSMYYSSIDGVLFSKDQKVIVHRPPGKEGSYKVPIGVTTIGDRAFYRNSFMTSVSLPNTVTSIGKHAFERSCGFVSIIIPSSVIEIHEKAFYGCPIYSVTIPHSVSYIGDGAFASFFTDVKSFSVSDSNMYYSALEGVLYNKDKTAIIAYPPNNSRNSYVIPSSVTSIGAYAFHNARQLKSIFIPSSVETIHSHAFNYCHGLTTICIPSSVKSICESAFEECNNLASVTLSKSIASLGSCAFMNCAKVESIKVYSSEPIPLISNESAVVFWGINQSTCKLYVPAGSKSSYASAYQWKDFSLIEEYDFSLSISNNDISITSTIDSSNYFNIISNTEWNVSVNQSWLNIRNTSGTDDGMVLLSAEANPNATQRTATITVSGTGVASQTVIVTQAANNLTGVSNNSIETIALYPNPVSAVLFIDGAAGNEMGIYGIQGTMLQNKTIESDHEAIDFSDMQPGIYLVKIGEKSFKVVK